MLFSKSFIPTLREDPKEADCMSHKLMLKGSLLYMLSSGIYSYLPVGLRVLNKIQGIIRKRMNEEVAIELFMSALQPIEIWKQTGRDETLKDVMLRFKDRKGRDMCLGPTHEEAITEIVKRYISSYKSLPVILYQIQTKFRDEMRPRFGLIRSCEFIMKDAYSFDADQSGLDANYEKMFSAYNKIFNDCGLDFVTTEADSGAMGGKESHEFMVPAKIGEDILYFCKKCNKYFKDDKSCPECESKLSETRMIEIGHVFKLGTKYSLAQKAYILDKQGKRQPIIMGCYGIGVSRLLPSIIEQNHDDKGIIWPKSVAPFAATLLFLGKDDKELYDEANDLYEKLNALGLEILFDERNEGPGVKFNDAYLLGNPYIIIIGKKYKETKSFELEIRKTREKLSFNKDDLIEFLKKEYEVK